MPRSAHSLPSERVVILGVGPCGLACADELKRLGHPAWTTLEAAPVPGGLGSSVVDPAGFTWDLGGHVVFSRSLAPGRACASPRGRGRADRCAGCPTPGQAGPAPRWTMRSFCAASRASGSSSPARRCVSCASSVWSPSRRPRPDRLPGDSKSPRTGRRAGFPLCCSSDPAVSAVSTNGSSRPGRAEHPSASRPSQVRAGRSSPQGLWHHRMRAAVPLRRLDEQEEHPMQFESTSAAQGAVQEPAQEPDEVTGPVVVAVDVEDEE